MAGRIIKFWLTLRFLFKLCDTYFSHQLSHLLWSRSRDTPLLPHFTNKGNLAWELLIDWFLDQPIHVCPLSSFLFGTNLNLKFECTSNSSAIFWVGHLMLFWMEDFYCTLLVSLFRKHLQSCIPRNWHNVVFYMLLLILWKPQ